MGPSRYTRHPWPITVLNRLGPFLDAAHLLPRLEPGALVDAACKKTGLREFGDEWFLEPLQVLVRSINEEANLSSLGRIIVRKRLFDALVTRLRAEALFTSRPEILEIDLGKVLVVAGLQRTGTTLLHRLTGSHPRIRATQSWECLDPIPGDRAKRIKQARTAERALKFIAPDFFAIHPVEHEMPEEDILLLDLSFMSQSSEATMHVPTYAKWLESRDHTRAYEYLKKMLQLLHWQNPARDTVLKSPHHMEYLETVLDVFPKTTIIQTHRDPQKTMASFISMVCHGAGVFSDEVDVEKISEHWQRKVHRLIERAATARSMSTEDRYLDILYQDLLADPMGQLERIYTKAGIEFGGDARQLAMAVLERQVKDKYGQHKYEMEDFGLSAAAIERDFGPYRESFGIPLEEGA